MKALIDADSLLYKACSVNQEVIEWDEDTITVIIDFDATKTTFNRYINEITDETDTNESLLVFSPKRTFRYDVLPTYKHNRKPQKHPLQLIGKLKEFALNKYNSINCEYIEADDYCVAEMYKFPTKYILCHIDKDLDQAPGNHYNYNKKISYIVNKKDAKMFFYIQTLTGDTVDGYKGCPGIGIKRAEKLLEDVEDADIWDVVVKAYNDKGLTEEDALQQAQVARMLRGREIDGLNEGELWQPKVKAKA